MTGKTSRGLYGSVQWPALGIHKVKNMLWPNRVIDNGQPLSQQGPYCCRVPASLFQAVQCDLIAFGVLEVGNKTVFTDPKFRLEYDSTGDCYFSQRHIQIGACIKI